MIQRKQFATEDVDNLMLSVYFRIDPDARLVHAFKSVSPLSIDDDYDFDVCCEYETFDIDNDDLDHLLYKWGMKAIETAMPE